MAPDIEPGRTYRVVTGVPGKTGVIYTLDRETWKIPVGAPDPAAEPCRQHRRSDRSRDGKPRHDPHRIWQSHGNLPRPHRRRELSRARLQPVDADHVFPRQQHLCRGERARPGRWRHRHLWHRQPRLCRAGRGRDGRRDPRGERGNRAQRMDLPAARGHTIAAHHRRRAAVRGRCRGVRLCDGPARRTRCCGA